MRSTLSSPRTHRVDSNRRCGRGWSPRVFAHEWYMATRFVLLPVLTFGYRGRMLRLISCLLCVLAFACGPTPGGGLDLDAGDEPEFDASVVQVDAGSVCEPGLVRCRGFDQVEECVGGFWQVAETCEQGSLCEAGVCEPCPTVSVSIETKQSCSIGLEPGTEIDGEGFISLQGETHRVFAMDRWGTGHIVGWCDSTTLGDLLMSFNVLDYLAQVPNPRVMSFGDSYLCQPGAVAGVTPLPESMVYAGTDLPGQYVDNPGQLAADWDVIVLCGFRMPWSTNWAAELEAFVADEGKGLLISMEYEGLAEPTDFTNASEISAPTGIQFNPLNLEWAPADTSIELDCVPDLPPIE